MILVTGASGGVGGAVVSALGAEGVSFRALYRAEPPSGKVAPGVSPVVADFADQNQLRKAIAGVETLFLVCSPIPALVELENNVIDVSAQCGVKHIVLNSALGAADYPKSFPSWHRKVEEKLKASKLAFTILRPNGFMQNILAYMAPSIRAGGAFYAAMGDAKTSFLDVRDIATAAANILINPAAHAGKIYELNGPEAVTNAQLAQRISRATGTTVKYIDIPEESQRKSMLGVGMPQWQVDALLDLQNYYRQGGGGEVTATLPSLLGRSPMVLDRFLSEFKSSFLASAQPASEEPVNPRTGMTFTEMKHFVRNHFDEFVNKKNLNIADVNFAPEFVDHGTDVPPGLPPGPAGAKAYVGGAYKRFPDIHVEILDLIAEDDRVVVRNHWTGTEAATGAKIQFGGIVIWRIAHRQLVERWAYLTPPHTAPHKK
jgi:uncharacterized protein YbjT (DUF2867 family)/predicted SnoaL-like aldol condensation-catalyzing enzyme